MQIIVTGADGFIGRNLRWRLKEAGFIDVLTITRETTPAALADAVSKADFVFHLAGVNRPENPSDFQTGNTTFTETLCRALESTGRAIPIAFSSSTQAALENPYGNSKRAAEDAVRAYSARTGSPSYIFRLTNVFGKWARPNYNSAVATFCNNIARGLPIKINDPGSPLKLVYIDDVTEAFVALLKTPNAPSGDCSVAPVYETTVGDVAQALQNIAASRATLISPGTGTGLGRALHATYLSYLPPPAFTYDLTRHEDPRGVFVEMLKTPDCGQFSFFTAHPGVTRGEHYHHSKTEKFLVIKGTAHYGFRNIDTGEAYETVVTGADSRIVETVPGWTHNITNIGSDELVVMLWANEIFDRERPDTFAMKVIS